jgi:glycosyltransferase involved in cell wall biosynthesis
MRGIVRKTFGGAMPKIRRTKIKGALWGCQDGEAPGGVFRLLNQVQAQAFCSQRLMYRDKKVVVVMPAYNAARTLRQTYAEVREQGLVDKIILVDDGSRDETVSVARSLEGVQVHVHEVNKGYGGNQKTCYRLALEAGADIVIMIHPDYQYTPKLIPAMVSIIGNGLHPCVLGSRILGGYALRGGMPLWKYVSNRCLTLAENILLGAKLSEYHSGYRAFSREILEKLRLGDNSDDFVFDNQMLAQILWHGFTIAEVSCPTKYFPEASSINLRRSIRYGFGCVGTGLRFRLAKLGIVGSKLFPPFSVSS